jgi:phage N-6-adenine-methyltransferase
MAEVSKAFLTSKRQDYMTPPEFMASLAGEFSFVLDIAASAKSAQAPRFYTEADDAFTQDWAEDAKAGAYFCNPPYSDKPTPDRPGSRPLSDWIFRAWWFRRKATGVWLLPANKTDQAWWHKLVIPYAEVRDVEGRIPFLDPDTGKKPKAKRVNKDTGEEEEVVNGNSQASRLVIFGPAYGPGPLRSHKWRAAK